MVDFKEIEVELTEKKNLLENFPLYINKEKHILYRFFSWLPSHVNENKSISEKQDNNYNLCITPLKAYIESYFLDKLTSLSLENIVIKDINLLNSKICKDIYGFIIKSYLLTILEFEFEKAKELELIPLEDEEKKSNSFKEYISLTNAEEWIEYFFEEYPVLYYQIENFLQNQEVFLVEIFKNIDKDLKDLQKELQIKSNELTYITLFLGDMHNRNRSTSLIKFGNQRFLYKPHSLASDIWFYNLVDKILPFPKVNHIDKSNYGYSEFIKQGNCQTVQEIKEYYYNFGMLSAMLYYLGTNDIIADNVIAGSKAPFLIDLETVVTPNHEKVDSFLSQTLFKSGILPDEFGFEKQKMSPFYRSFPTIEQFDDANKDYYSPSTKRYKEITTWLKNVPSHLEECKHLPRLDGKSIEIRGYEDIFCNGFTHFCINLSSNLKDVITYPSIKVRLLLRNTSEYLNLLKEGQKPYYVRSVDNFLELFTILEINRDTEVYQSEISQIALGDVPYFYINTTNKNLYDVFGSKLSEDFYKTSIEKLVTDRLNTDTKTVLEHNLFIVKEITNYFKGLEINRHTAFSSIFDLKLSNPTDLKTIIYTLFSHLWSKTIDYNNEIVCCDIYPNKNAGYSMGIMSDELHNGISGIAIFCLSAFVYTKDDSFVEYFDAIKDKIVKKPLEKDLIAFTSYETNSLYLHLLEVNYLDRKIDNKLIDDYYEFLFKNIENDNFIDIILGSSSIINFLIENNQFFDTEKTQRLISIFLEKLLKHKVEIDDNCTAWKFKENLSDKLVGFSHGAAGILYTLCNIYQYTKNNSLLKYIEKTYNYIASLYSEKEGRWKEEITDESIFNSCYHHGSSGIGLSLLKMYEINPKEQIVNFLNLIILDIIKSIPHESYCLANGNIGNLVIAKQIIETLQNKLPQSTVSLYKTTLDEMTFYDLLKGSRNIDGFIVYNLYLGISGLGYGLIKQFSTEKTANVLTFKI